MCKLATIPTTERSITSLKTLAETLAKLFSSPNWQTFMLVAEEQAPASLPNKDYPTNEGGGSGGGGQMIDGFEIPPDVGVPPEAFNQQAQGGGGDNATAAGGGGGNDAGGMQVCPHCTFENNPGAQDCDICGLPLSG